MGKQAERRQGSAVRGGNVGWRGEVSVRVALVYGAVAGGCTTLGVALLLLFVDGLSGGRFLLWLLLAAAGPAMATRLFSMPMEKRRWGRAIGHGLGSVLWPTVMLAPFSSVFAHFLPTDARLWPLLLVWLFSSGFCALWVGHVSREEKPAAAARAGVSSPESGSGSEPQSPFPSQSQSQSQSPPPLLPSPPARSVEEEQAVTEFGELLAHHPFDASLPGVEYVERADYSLALNAYERAKAARPGEVLGILAEGRTALARLDARMGLDTVQSRTGCFFDHRHGPAVTSVQWTPAGGTRRRIEVCRADAVRLADERGRWRRAF
ncbi:hypothetical protein [Streptomyces sp. NPDC059452]|uniref:hypothetical protein n=1 Tax=Streptomyces sp. NPDC059452 TaxID=3346835 RepID=UPI0036A64EFE